MKKEILFLGLVFAVLFIAGCQLIDNGAVGNPVQTSPLTVTEGEVGSVDNIGQAEENARKADSEIGSLPVVTGQEPDLVITDVEFVGSGALEATIENQGNTPISFHGFDKNSLISVELSPNEPRYREKFAYCYIYLYGNYGINVGGKLKRKIECIPPEMIRSDNDYTTESTGYKYYVFDGYLSEKFNEDLTISMVIDPNNVIIESNENNNVFSRTFSLKELKNYEAFVEKSVSDNVICLDITEAHNFCLDSDNSVPRDYSTGASGSVLISESDLFVKGTTIGLDSTKTYITNQTDTCDTAGIGIKNDPVAYAGYSFMYEWFCDKGIVSRTFTRCPTGYICNDGACVPTTTTTTIRTYNSPKY